MMQDTQNAQDKILNFFQMYADVIKQLHPATIAAISHRVANDLAPDDDFRFQIYYKVTYDILDFLNLLLNKHDENFFNALETRLNEFKQVKNEAEYIDATPKRDLPITKINLSKY